MKPTSVELLGYQFLNAGVLLLSAPNASLSEEAKRRTLTALPQMVDFLTSAAVGLLLTKGSKASKKLTLSSMREGAKAEHEYKILAPILPTNSRKAMNLLRGLTVSCGKILNGEKVAEERLKELHEFCHRFSDHLDKLRAERVGY